MTSEVAPAPPAERLPAHPGIAQTGRRSPEPPRYVLAGGLLFWGWHTGLWWLGLVLALLAELPSHRHWQFELASRERERVADLCTVLVVLAGAYLYLTQPRLGTALIVLIQWLPALVFPLLAMQLYGRREGIELSVLFLSLRGGKQAGGRRVDLRWGYLLACMISASMIPPETPWYFPSLTLLAVWALSRTRPELGRQASARQLARLTMLAAAAALAFGLAQALRWGHGEVEMMVLRWMEHRMGAAADPYRSTTAIGEVGELKGSDRIRLRVYPRRPLDGALLLRTASYDRYFDETWFTSGSLSQPLASEDGVAVLSAGDAAADTTPETTQILLRLDRTEGLLPLPPGARRLEGLARADLHRTDFGTVRYQVRGSPAHLRYRVAAAPPMAPARPDDTDRRLSGPQQAAVRLIAEELGLNGLAPAEVPQRLQRFFQHQFRYSLSLDPVPADTDPLTHFLLQSRAGHCEYFATAAVMLLREAGLPARYARGWSVQEYSALEDAWIARDSHAHAWVLVWIDGAWRNFDPTPPDWSLLEAAERPSSLAVADVVAWLRLQLSGAGDAERGTRAWLLAPLVLLIMLLAWRIARRARRGDLHKRAASGPKPIADAHPFARVERAAARRGLYRRDGETLREWALRIDASPVAGNRGAYAGTLLQAVELHYRGRFDPRCADEALDARLQALLAECLRRLN
ncbi:MAG: transglutaminase-like domain-containing protein [Thiohalocapsa sp.]|nr:transglutaminase-like domain-containing protein [Thiohalocapsa sp.]